jgi:hypothetical protein
MGVEAGKEIGLVTISLLPKIDRKNFEIIFYFSFVWVAAMSPFAADPISGSPPPTRHVF